MLEKETSSVQNSFIVEEDNIIKDRSFEILCSHERKIIWAGVKDGRRMVLKGLPKTLRNHPEEEARLRKEYLLYTAIDHPGVVRAYGFLQHQEFGPVIEMEYIDGISLNEYLHPATELSDKNRPPKFPSLSERRRIAYEIADTLATIHDHGITHRDLKPDNIMVTRRNMKAKIIDLGHGDSDDYVIFKMARSTRHYGAPEMQKSSIGEPGSDVYSFGQILNELLPERKYRSLRMDCLAADSNHRPTMRDVVSQLKGNRSRRSHRILLAFFGIMLAVAGVAVSIFLKNIESESASVLSTSPINRDSLHIREVVSEKKNLQMESSSGKASGVEANNEQLTAENRLREHDPVGNKSPEEIEKQCITRCDAVIDHFGPIPVNSINDTYKVCMERDILRNKRYEECKKISTDLVNGLKRVGVDSIDAIKSVHRFWNHYTLNINKTDRVTE